MDHWLEIKQLLLTQRPGGRQSYRIIHSLVVFELTLAHRPATLRCPTAPASWQ